MEKLKNKHNFLIFIFVIISILISTIDQFLKVYIAKYSLLNGLEKTAINHNYLNKTTDLKLQGLTNYYNLSLIITAIIVYCIIYIVISNKKQPLFYISMGLISGGSVSIILTKIKVEPFFYYLDFLTKPILTIADLSVITGIVIFLFIQKQKEKRDNNESKKEKSNQYMS